jgi:hypothetical protein
MKEFRSLLVGMIVGIGLIAGWHLLQAQDTVTTDLNNLTAQDLNSMSDMQVLLLAVRQTPTIPATAAPRWGTFWSAQHAPGTPHEWPPMPGNVNQSPMWNLGDDQFLLDDFNVDYAAISAQAELEAALTSSSMMKLSMKSSSLSTAYAYGNPVYLTNMAAVSAGDGSMTASFSIVGGTNFVPYDILMVTNLVTPAAQWNWLGIGYTSNRYTFPRQPSDIAFYKLARPSKTMTVGFGNDSVGQCDVPFGLTNVLQVAGGGGQSLALRTDGTVVAWGQNYYGQATVPTNLTGVAMVSAGWYHSLAMLTNGTVIAWGINSSPLFGGLNVTNVPASLTNAIVISAQALHSLALTSNGTVVAWGYDGGTGVTNVPAGLSNVVAIAAGYLHNLAVTTNSNGTVVAWGANGDGQCSVPAGLSNVVDVAAGAYHSLALLQNGTVVAWGDDIDGEIDVPAGLTNVVAIAASGDPDYAAYSMALKSDGTVVVWGDDAAANPGGGLNDVVAIGAGADHALAVRTGPPTPVITLEPTDEYQVPGGNATFTARGAGLYGVIYQWQSNGVNVTGATAAALTVTNVQAAQTNGYYDVVVTDNTGWGSIVSSNASLHFVTPPVILSQSPLPTNQTVLYLTNVSLSVMATAPGMTNGFPLSYQWQFNGMNVGGNSASYVFQANANSTGTYSVVVSNAAGSTNAAWYVTVIGSHLQIIQQPSNQYQIAGGSVTFVSSAISSNTVAYQWQFNATNIVGATNSVLTLANVQAAQQGNYDAVINDSVNNLTSSNATFYLVTPPAIVSQTFPTNIVPIFQTNVILSIEATAPGLTNGFPLGYQWQFDGTNISGQTLSNYTFTAINSGHYSIIVTNAAGSTSATWQVTVNYGTLAYYLATNAVGYANGYSPIYSNMLELANWTSATYSGTNLALLTNAVWSTNCWLHGVQGLSATCIGYSNGISGQFLITMVSPRHYLRANHIGALSSSTLIAFLDTNNVIYWRTAVQETRVATSDTDVGILNADLPSSIGYLPVTPTNWANYLPTANYVQGIGLHQDLSLFSQPMQFSFSVINWSSQVAPLFGLGTNWDIGLYSGDSSNPEMLLVGNELVLTSHNFTANSGPNYAGQFDAINQQMHYLSTNNAVGSDYHLTQFTLTNWPSLH